jgi:hypothetical protein
MELIGDRNGESDASDGLIRVPIEYLLLFNRCRRGANSIRLGKFFSDFRKNLLYEFPKWFETTRNGTNNSICYWSPLWF